MCGIACLQPMNCPLRLTATSRSKTAMSRLTMSMSMALVEASDALLCNTSRPPNDSTAVSTIRTTLDSSETSTSATTALPSSPATRSAAGPSMSATTTDAPSCPISRAVASPMPLPAPVTIATLPSRRPTARAYRVRQDRTQLTPPANESQRRPRFSLAGVSQYSKFTGGRQGMARWTRALTRAEWIRLSGFGSAVLFLHLLGWGLFLYYARDNPALAGLGTLAYTFGLRHAFDADHIAAIDNTTRALVQQGKRSLGVGFFFSLGHSTIVLSLVAGLAIAAKSVGSSMPGLREYGSYLGAGVSGIFLWLIAIGNLLVLLDLLRIFRELRHGACDEQHLERRLLARGFAARMFSRCSRTQITSSWQMYPVGILFGLGF